MGSRGGFNQEAALGEPGIIGLADSLVHVEPQYRGLASYLLGRVVVAENIDCAIALARKFRYSLRIVTLEGELLSAGGSMTGGAFKNSSNLLGRRREIEELEAACKKGSGAGGRDPEGSEPERGPADGGEGESGETPRRRPGGDLEAQHHTDRHRPGWRRRRRRSPSPPPTWCGRTRTWRSS